MSRPFPRHTPLGRHLADSGMSAKVLGERTHIYGRTLTEYLAGRKPIPVWNLAKIADVLGVDPEDLQPAPSEVSL